MFVSNIKRITKAQSKDSDRRHYGDVEICKGEIHSRISDIHVAQIGGKSKSGCANQGDEGDMTQILSLDALWRLCEKQ